jgi:hypothetical protein
MSTIEERLRDAVRTNYDAAEVRIDDDSIEDLQYSTDKYGVYWVSAQVAISPVDLWTYPNTNPIYSVWMCEDYSDKEDWSEVSDWQLDECYQSESDDETGVHARKQAHDRAKYLRNGDANGILGALYAVRPNQEPPPLLPFAKNKNTLAPANAD